MDDLAQRLNPARLDASAGRREFAAVFAALRPILGISRPEPADSASRRRVMFAAYPAAA
jgi:hypothetical protein